MIYADSHSHLHLPALATLFSQVCQRHPNSYFAAAAAEESDWPLLLAWKQQNPRRRAICLGLHPSQAESQNMLECLERLQCVLEQGGVSAVGEIGLDYALPVNRKQQQELLQNQLRIALEANLPVVLHGVRCHGQMIETLKKCSVERGMVHGFNGHPQVLLGYLKQGMLISLNSSQLLSSREHGTEGKWREIVQNLPLSRLMLESDCCLDRNGNARTLIDTELVAQRIATYKGCSENEVLECAVNNMLYFYALT